MLGYGSNRGIRKGVGWMKLASVDVKSLDRWEKKFPKRCVVDRDSAIVRLSENKRVLHLGAADAPFHMEKAKAGKLLHQKVRKVARKVVGLDSDAEAVAWLQAEVGIDDIRCGDVMKPPEDHVWFDEPFDTVLCTDVIEHVENPGLLLGACKRYLSARGTLVLSTINATSGKPFLRALAGREAVHHEHIAYFSYGTLAVLLKRCGLMPEEVGFFLYQTRHALPGWIFQALGQFAPGTGDGIIMTARRAN